MSGPVAFVTGYQLPLSTIVLCMASLPAEETPDYSDALVAGTHISGSRMVDLLVPGVGFRL